MKRLFEILLFCSLSLVAARSQEPRYHYSFHGPALTVPGFEPSKAIAGSDFCAHGRGVDRAASCFTGYAHREITAAVRALYEQNPRKFSKNCLHKPVLIVTITDTKTGETKRVVFTAEQDGSELYAARAMP